MTLEALTQRLAAHYRVERELGAGGMATVYLAHDLKHDRKVALKVLRPELAAAVGAERFLREIKVTANLRHPHILPLFDSGTARVESEELRGVDRVSTPLNSQLSTILYYVMPYIEGETLRDRIDREKQLPLDDALRIAGEVADALSYAHGKGVVHRDIKPENILLENGHAVVADFGIARALSTAGTTSLTETGMAIGTPAYMSPEQASGESDLDGRTDCYALACVTYEMLAGQPPFTGPTAQSIVGQHLGAAPRLVTEIRPAVPAAVASAVQRALAKAPADRFPSLGAFAAALQAGQAAGGPVGRWRTPLAALALVALLALGWFGVKHLRDGGPILDPDIIAVLPFRVGGPSTEYLRESMLDLLQTRLSSTTGPRTTEPRTLLAAWRRAVGHESDDLSEDGSRALARELGAGRVLLGSAIATPTELTLSGTLLNVADGAVLARENVAGAPDSIAILVNRLTAALLIRGAGESAEREAGLVAAPLDALQDYLAGQKAYRRGDFFGAMTLYGKAFARDSTFVEAGFRMATTNAWIGTVYHTEGFVVVPRVWAMRRRLSPRDQALFLALPIVGPNYPRPSNDQELIAQAERAAAMSPDDPESQLLVGQLLSGYGAVASIPDWPARAVAQIDRAIALDSSYTRAIEARIWVALLTDDTLAMSVHGALLERRVAEGYGDPFYLWAVAKARGDSGTARHWRDRMDALGRVDRSQALGRITLHSAALALPLDDAHWAVAELRRAARTPEEIGGAILTDYALRFAEGRAIPSANVGDETYGPGWAASQIQVGLVDRGFRPLGEMILAREAAGGFRYGAIRWPPLQLCLGTIHRALQGDTTGYGGAIRKLREFIALDPPPVAADVWAHVDPHICPLVLELLRERPPAKGTPWPRLDTLDGLMRVGHDWLGGSLGIAPTAFVNYTIARLREAQGDLPAALGAIRRREVDYYPAYLWTLPAFLRQEGRLAALTGDTAGAVRAYDKYLVLRTDPDPLSRPQRDSVLAERSALMRRPVP